MGNYLDYLYWRGDLSLEQAPLNEIDCAILAEISGFPFDLIGVRAHEESTIADAVSELMALGDLEEHIPSRRIRSMIQTLSTHGERFWHMPILEFRNIFDESHVVQFAVVTIQIAPELFYVSFRGTDHTLTGWEEDFNMGVEFPVPSQKLAVIYVNGLKEKLQGTFILGGHSKGGNLAVYAGAFCEKDMQARIHEIYNFDGPGFESWIMAQPAYLEIADRIHTFVPQSSIIGMLLEQADGYQVVKSSEDGGMAAHRMISWEVERTHFVKMESVTQKSLFLDATITEWLHGMHYDQRKTFVKILFQMLRDAKVKSLSDLNLKRIPQLLSLIKSYSSLDPDTKQHMKTAISALIQCAREEAPSFGMEGFRMFRDS